MTTWEKQLDRIREVKQELDSLKAFISHREKYIKNLEAQLDMYREITNKNVGY